LSKNEKKSTQPQETIGIAEQLKKRIDWLGKQEKNVNVEIEILEKRLKKYTEGIPKTEKRLKEMKAKQKKIAERKAKELQTVAELSKAFLPKLDGKVEN
jgi:chromosome segregation ATPase